jgi:hypothetical protein
MTCIYVFLVPECCGGEASISAYEASSAYANTPIELHSSNSSLVAIAKMNDAAAAYTKPQILTMGSHQWRS